MEHLYFDAASTTLIHPEVFDAMLPYLTDNYGNASSHYSLGVTSKKAIENAREIIAASINCRPEEIYFTSGGSEANNWAVKGIKNRYHIKETHIITSNIEHHSITEALRYRWNEVGDIAFTCVPVEINGVIDSEKLADSFRLNTRLCSIMYVNNELGTIQPIDAISSKCYDNGVLFHTDAVQAYGHLPIDVKKQNINLMSASAHKIHGPKGIGFLYISNDYKSQMNSFVHGGQQEHGMRASTENVAAIVGFGRAAEIALKTMDEKNKSVKDLAIQLQNGLKDIVGLKINCPIELTDYRHINVRIDGVRSEQLMGMLDLQDIFISAGSACNSDSNSPSHVLKAIGLSDEEANSSIRISLDDNTPEEVEQLIKCLKYDIEVIRRK